MNSVLHKANTRGGADHGWLQARHTFSFADYYDEKRMSFGMLRVLNDDIIAPSMGFGTHPHQNMEIITIPITGALMHKDTLGNEEVIKAGEVQVMSAGTGIYHSEFNPLDDKHSNTLQTWVLPKEMGVKPRYDQKAFDLESNKNKLHLLVSPDGEDDSLSINQDAYYSQVILEKDKSITYNLKVKNHGVYLFVISGEVKVNDQILSERDGLGLINLESVEVNALHEANVLFIEVPMGE